jgi:hypothetical protein
LCVFKCLSHNIAQLIISTKDFTPCSSRFISHPFM